TGERATDGDTGQVGPGIASWLDMSLVTYVSKLVQITDTHIQAERLIEEGYQIVEAALPAVLTVVKEIASPRLPTLKGKKRAMKLEITKWGARDLDLDAEVLGLKGSPTRVVKIETPTISRKCTVVRAGDDQSIRSAVDQLMEFLEQKDLLSSKIAPPRENMNPQKSAASRRETNNENLSRKKATTGNAPALKDSGCTGGEA
ncbi:MAG: hypothetical protein K9K78_08480, partial [Spirochaetales bacterium]|nr:hypothetical protein [Spirochaetales bacterium]